MNNSKNDSKQINIVIAASVIMCSFVVFYGKTSYYKPEKVPVPVIYEPQQINLPPEYKLSLTGQRDIKNQDVFIYAQAYYKIYCRVVHIMPYYTGISGGLAPVDFAVVWGELVKKENYSNIDFKQSGRWAYFRPKEKCLYDNEYISKHFSNMHIIPADENVLAGLKKVKKFDEIYLEGYLVNIESFKNGKLSMTWNSSLSRDDKGDGACEVMYVTKIINKQGKFESAKNH